MDETASECPKYGIFDGRFWWKEDRMDAFIVFEDDFETAKKHMKEYGDDTVLCEFIGEDIFPVFPLNKPVLDAETEELCRKMYS